MVRVTFRAILAFIIFALSCQLNAVIILTHGFKAQHASWYQPGGDAYEALKEIAAEKGHSLEHFTWDQSKGYGYTVAEQKAGGISLAQRVLNFCNEYEYNPELPNDHEIIVVAHSYGGLTSYYAAHFLGIANTAAQKDITPALADEPQEGISSYFNTVKSFIKNLWRKSSEKIELPVARPVISQLFTLGTPHTAGDPKPHPAGVKTIYNIHSPADLVAGNAPRLQIYTNPNPKQTTYWAALPEEILAHHPGAYDIRLLAGDSVTCQEAPHDQMLKMCASWFQIPIAPNGFTHTTIHDPIVMKNIFNIVQHVRGNNPPETHDFHNFLASPRAFTFTIHGDKSTQNTSAQAQAPEVPQPITPKNTSLGFRWDSKKGFRWHAKSTPNKDFLITENAFSDA